MDDIEELVKRKINIFREYWFFNEFMNTDSPDNKKFIEALAPFLDDLRTRGFNKRELNILKHLSFLSTYPKEKRQAMLERWLTAELTHEFISIKLITNPLDGDLKRFYKDVYEGALNENETEPLNLMRIWVFGENWTTERIDHWWDSRKYKNVYGHVVRPRYYILVVKIKGIVVGGAIVNTLTTEKMSFMAIDFFRITLQHLSEIESLKEFNTGKYKVKLAISLFERCKHYAVKDAVRYGHRQPFFILGEASDPIKMHEKGVLNQEYDTENPVLRLRLYSILGFRFLDFNYIQPSLEEGQEVVDYLHAAIYPFSKEFYNEIDPAIFKYALVTYLGTWPKVDVTQDPVKQMADSLDDLSGRGIKIRLMNFQELRIPSKIVDACANIWKTDELTEFKVRDKSFSIEPLSYATLKGARDLANRFFPDEGLERPSIAFPFSLALRGKGYKPLFLKKLLKVYGVSEVHYWVVVHNRLKKVVAVTGLYCYTKDKDEADWGGWMCVDEEYKSYGIAFRIGEFIIAKARERGKKYLRLYTSTSPNEATANLLFDRYGFKVTKRERIRGTPYEYLYREKEL